MKNCESDIDLVLVNPGNRTQSYQSLGATLSAIEPPVLSRTDGELCPDAWISCGHP
jgi:hypothetical protein